MKARTPLTIVALMGTATVILRLVISYQKWKQRIIKDLQANSHISNTACGPIEYSMKNNKHEPIVLIAHGTPGGYDQSVAFSLLFTRNISSISISRPGYLRTPLSNNETPEAQADLYAALLDKLGIEQVTMLGMSGGGPSALQFAIRHPERCSKLVLVCAVTYHYDEQGRVEALSLIQRFFQQQIMRFLSPDVAYFFLATHARWVNTPIGEPFYRSYTRSDLRTSGYENDVVQLAHLQTYPLECITAPTLVLHGNADENVPVEYAKYAVAHIPNAQLVIDEGGNHDFFMQHKERVIPIIEAFV